MEINSTGPSNAIPHFGGYGSVAVTGTFNGSTITVEIALPRKPDVWVPLKDTNGNAISFSAGGVTNFLAPECKVRVNVADASPNTVDFYIYRLPVITKAMG